MSNTNYSYPYPEYSEIRNSVSFYEMDQTSINAEVQRWIKTGLVRTPYEDFGMIMTSKEIGFPEVRKQQIVIPALDGVLDLTDRLADDVIYGNRKITLSFDMIDPSQWSDRLADLANFLHGKYIGIQFKVRDIEDAEYIENANYYGFDDHFFFGRGEINPFLSDKNIGKVVIDFDCEPFRVNETKTSGNSDVTISTNFYLSGRKPLLCTFLSTVGGYLEIKTNTDEEIDSKTVEANVETVFEVIIGRNYLTFTPTESTSYTYTIRTTTGDL